MKCGLVGLIFITCPPKRSTSGLYSDSGSEIIMSSSVTKNAFAISLFAAKDLPDPGVPKISPFGFLSRRTFLLQEIFQGLICSKSLKISLFILSSIVSLLVLLK